MGMILVRVVDRWVGIPLCAALTILRKIAGLTVPDRSRHPVTRVMFLKPAEQGATLLAAPAIANTAERLGRENVFVCVFAKNRDIVDILDLVPRENVLTIRDTGFFPFVLDTVWMVAACRRLRIDATVDLEFFARITAILAFLTGAPVRVGLHRHASEGTFRGDLLTHRVLHNPYLSAAEGYAILAEAVFTDPDQLPMLKAAVPAYVREYRVPRYVPDPAEEARVRGLLDTPFARSLPAPPVRVVLNPKFHDELPVRQWPPENYREVAARTLAEFPGVQILVAGLPGEAAAAEAFCAALDPERVVNLAGKLTFHELLALLSLCDVIVGSDSGPAHFAAMTDMDILVFFGPETPLLYAPLSPRNVIFYERLACSPCFNVSNFRFSFCADNQCLKRITPEAVHAELRRVIAARIEART